MAKPTVPAPGDDIVASWGSDVAKTINGIQAGAATIVFPNNAVATNLVVTFPVPYATPPVVMVCSSGGSSSVNINPGVVTVTTTTFTVGAREIRESAINGNMQISWIAVGTLP
jgi:H-type lectin domain